MSCYNHGERAAMNTCCSCGQWLCDDCTVTIEGRNYCKNCVGALLREGKPHLHHASGGHHAKRSYSGILLFICSLLPGAGYMYLGLMKRGLFFMAAFFLTSYLTGSWNMGILGLVIPIICITTLFDGFKKMKLLMCGVNVEDSVDDVIGFFHKHKKLIFIFIAIMLVDWFMNVGISFIAWSFPFVNLYNAKKLLSLALIIGGLYVLFSRKRRSRGESSDEFNDSNKPM